MKAPNARRYSIVINRRGEICHFEIGRVYRKKKKKFRPSTSLIRGVSIVLRWGSSRVYQSPGIRPAKLFSGLSGSRSPRVATGFGIHSDISKWNNIALDLSLIAQKQPFGRICGHYERIYLRYSISSAHLSAVSAGNPFIEFPPPPTPSFLPSPRAFRPGDRAIPALSVQRLAAASVVKLEERVALSVARARKMCFLRRALAYRITHVANLSRCLPLASSSKSLSVFQT